MAIVLDKDKSFFSDWPLLYHTQSSWVECVLNDFNHFLSDHASNERKAAATAMEFVVKYPDKLDLVTFASRIACEELEHFRQVFEVMKARSAPLKGDEKCQYARYMRRHAYHRGPERLLDMLFINSVTEFRGMERFYLISQNVEDPKLKDFYFQLSMGEKGHGWVYLHEAKKLFPDHDVQSKFLTWLDIEKEAIIRAPLEPRLFA